ncbi:MAG: hypothetical protein MUE78_09730 [Ilumatobacteraceae bacterium]|nr:hypothetical protein [Ilumatobacteraceae bacterium]
MTITVVGSLLALAACGDDSASTGDDAGLAPPRPIEVAGSGGGATAGRVAAESADMSVMPWFGNVEYVLGPDFPALPTSSTGYEYPAGVTVTEEAVRELAAALGIEGEPVPGQGADIDGLAWRVGPDDGSAPSLTVSADTQGSWYASSAWGRDVAVGCAQAVDEEGNPVGEPCPEPEPPVGVPTQAEATELATELLTALGLDPATVELEVYADEWSASATVWPLLDGLRSPVAWGFGWGGDAVLQWANGALNDPIATGPFTLVDLDTALTRLDEQGGWWGGIARGGLAGGIEPMPLDAGVPEPAPIDPAVDPAVSDPAVEPGSEPETITVTLVGVEADLWWAWEPDGSVWLLPAYRFLDADGIGYTVPAVTDEYVTQAPVPDTTVPATDVPPPAETTAPPASTPPTVPAETVPAASVPTEPTVPAELDALVGLEVEAATAAATELGYELRVARLDGEDLALTMDFVENRANVAVEGGLPKLAPGDR